MTERTFFTEKGATPVQISTVAVFYENLTSNGIGVDRIELTTTGDVNLECTPTDTDGLSMSEANEKVGGELGYIIGSYAGTQQESVLGELEDLNVTVHTHTGKGSWSVKSEWVEAYNSGQWDDETFFQTVLETLTEVN